MVKKKIEKRKLHEVVLMVFFFLINLASVFLFSNTLEAKIETMSSLISKTAMQFSSTNTINMNFLNQEIQDGGLVSSEISLAKEITAGQKQIGPQYNARVSFNPTNTNYFSSDVLSHKTPSIILSSIFSNHLNAKKEIVHDVFELKLMFKDPNAPYSGFNNFCYITQEDADYMILNNANYLSYSDLIGEGLEILYKHDDSFTNVKWKISNVILNDEGIDSFLKKTYGSYILAYFRLPNYAGISLDFDFGVSNVTNLKKIKELMAYFPSDKTIYKINTFNCPEIDNYSTSNIVSYFSQFNHEDRDSIKVAIIVTTLLLVFYLFLYFFITKQKTFVFKKNFLFFIFAIYFVLYYAFNIMTKLNVYFMKYFSLYSILYNLFLLLALVIVTLISRRYKKNDWQCG